MRSLTRMILLTHIFVTLSMTGIIWYIQWVHYPIFGHIPESVFSAYETFHVRMTILVVVPLMLTETATGLALLKFRPSGIGAGLVWTGLFLLGVIGFSTVFLQIPQHRILAQGFNSESLRFLIHSNWIRTAAWTVRSFLVLKMILVSDLSHP